MGAIRLSVRTSPIPQQFLTAIPDVISYTKRMNLRKDNDENSFYCNVTYSEEFYRSQFAQWGEKGKNEATMYVDYHKYYVSFTSVRREFGL